MRPMLAEHLDGGEQRRKEIRDALADEFQLSPEEREELLPSGTQPRFQNRVNWTAVHLIRAGALRSAGRGLTELTDRGRELLEANPERVDIGVLDQFPEYREFRSGSSAGREIPPTSLEEAPGQEDTPAERLEAAHDELNAALAEEILDRLIENDDVFFEKTVLDLLVALGYGGSRREAAERVGRSGDGGIDGVIREDRLGLDVIFVQAKKWSPDRHVGPREIREFLGAIQDAGATRGVFITTSRFSIEAAALAERRRIVLIGGRRMAELMIEAGVGVSRGRTFVLSAIDEDYFAEGDGSGSGGI
jgi:restriction system protein